MNSIEKNLMLGMIDILNQAIESKNNGIPIINDDDIDIRLADLEEFENETNVMFVTSPNCKVDLESIVNIKGIKEDNLKEYKDVSEIVEYFNEKEVLVYLDIVGTDLIVTYTNGCLTNVQSNYGNSKKIIKRLNIPYKIKKDGVYTVKGKVIHDDKLAFYVNDVIEGGNGNLKDDLNEVKKLNFDTVQFWFAKKLNQNSLKDTLDYVMNYVADDNLECDGAVFKFNEKKFNNIMNFNGCYYSKWNKENV